jgi:two-component system LytT family response regulator
VKYAEETMSAQLLLDGRSVEDGRMPDRPPHPIQVENPVQPIRCFVVDDERLARLVLRSQLDRHPDLSIIGEAADLVSADSGIRTLRPDVLFLDVGMRGQNGFELVRKLGSRSPLIVFVTAYDQFALQAFEFRAVDYLVKPISTPRFDEAVDRLRERLRPAHCERSSAATEEALFVQAGRGGCWISPRDIVFIQSDRNYSTVNLADGERVIVRQTMSGWRQRLSSPDFVHLDRSLILNLQQVRRTDLSGHSGQVYFAFGTTPLSLGRQGTARLRSLVASDSGDEPSRLSDRPD